MGGGGAASPCGHTAPLTSLTPCTLQCPIRDLEAPHTRPRSAVLKTPRGFSYSRGHKMTLACLRTIYAGSAALPRGGGGGGDGPRGGRTRPPLSPTGPGGHGRCPPACRGWNSRVEEPA